MSKKKSSAKAKAEATFDQQFDALILPLLTPEIIASLLQDQQFVKEVVRETKQALANPSDVQQLGAKYSFNTKDVETGLEQTIEDLTALLGDDSE
ncbi:MAG: hypothetical protein NWS20_01205 [Rickettsiaceae bacterium]|nr:hypothetical protein [Rickettsiaceae bacterium]MDP4832658.1 hypothetical protein [Rickettsiaceae bacterium]MDP5020278.1 hypothetical protein [Rickettsiaceae bacterium]MDP5083699.1 hypothetical protein [Rickettsiaceae bacterium]